MNWPKSSSTNELPNSPADRSNKQNTQHQDEEISEGEIQPFPGGQTKTHGEWRGKAKQTLYMVRSAHTALTRSSPLYPCFGLLVCERYLERLWHQIELERGRSKGKRARNTCMECSVGCRVLKSQGNGKEKKQKQVMQQPQQWWLGVRESKARWWEVRRSEASFRDFAFLFPSLVCCCRCGRVAPSFAGWPARPPSQATRPCTCREPSEAPPSISAKTPVDIRHPGMWSFTLYISAGCA